MSDTKLPLPRSWSTFNVCKGKLGTLNLILRDNTIVFRNDVPIAILELEIVYYPDTELLPADMRVIHSLAKDRMLQRTQIHNFDFLLAQALQRTAVPWTKIDLPRLTP